MGLVFKGREILIIQFWRTKDMKKKLAAVVLSMVLCLGASVTTLAAGSPSANNSSTTTSQTTTTTTTTTTPTTSTEVKVEQKAITQDVLNDVQKEKLGGYFTDMTAIDNDTTLTAEQKVEKKAATVQTMINSVLGLNYSYKSGVYGTYELTATDLSNPIAISVAGIKAGDTVVVAHLTSAGVWENVPVTNVADGVVYAKFTSLSPVFVASVADTNAAATSPKTADAGMNMAMILVVVIAATGAVVYARRRMNYTK